MPQLLLTVRDSFVIERGLVLVGRAPEPETEWPNPGERVELRPPGRPVRLVDILGVDHGLTRSCFSDGRATRAILLAPELPGEDWLPGTEVWRVT